MVRQGPGAWILGLKSFEGQAVMKQYGRDMGSVYGYSHVSRKRRSKADWAGVGLGDGYKHNLEYYLRRSALRAFYRIVKHKQRQIAGYIGRQSELDPEPRVKPQVSPFYTSYPSGLSAQAAIGWTILLEYKARVGARSLEVRLKGYLENPVAHDLVDVDPQVYQQVARTVTETVQSRLLLEELSRIKRMQSVEIYRLVSASQQNLRLNSLPEILRTVLLYGDVLPAWQEMNLHPLTRSILMALTVASERFFEQVSKARTRRLTALGHSWVRAVCRQLAPFLPPAEEESDELDLDLDEALDPDGSEPTSQRFGKPNERDPGSDRIAPLDGPNPPSLFEDDKPIPGLGLKTARDPSSRSAGAEHQADNEAASEVVNKTLGEFFQALKNAGGQQQNWQDMRSDLIEQAVGKSFSGTGPIQGNPAEGHEVQLHLGGDKLAGGEIFDRPVELSDDLMAYEKLLKEAEPTAKSLARALYPNVQHIPNVLRLRTGGTLDASRLALAEISQVVFKRYRMLEQLDRRGKAVLLLACDASGSLDADDMKMVKILATSWLNSTIKSDVQVLAGLYHSGQIRDGLSGPLVQWMYHPVKTPAVSRVDAARALVSLPERGTGVQSDALSLAFMLEEARQLARGNMVYLILLSDTAWNRSFSTEKDGFQEVATLFDNVYEKYGDRLHSTLVALGVSEETGLEDILDRVICVSKEELKNHGAIAEKIGLYVASCIRERRLKSKTR